MLNKRNYLNRVSSFLKRKSIIAFVVIVVVSFAGYKLIRGRASSPVATSNNNGQIDLQKPKASTDVNYEFTFPLKDANGEEVSKVKYIIEKAEIRDEIIVQGKKYGSIKGRTFLILNLKIKNDYNKAIEVDTRNYVRLSVNKNEGDWLAPDIHNDPVEVQAISTKNTRIAFPIYDTDRDFVLQIGEIKGEKQKVELKINK